MIEALSITTYPDNRKEYVVYIEWNRRDITSILSDNDKRLIDIADNMNHVKELILNALWKSQKEFNF